MVRNDAGQENTATVAAIQRESGMQTFVKIAGMSNNSDANDQSLRR